MPPAIKQAPLTTRSGSLRCVSAATHHTAEHYSKTGKTKPQKHLPTSNLPWNTLQDFLRIHTKSLRSCSEDRAKMLLKGQLRIKCHSQYIQIIRLLQHRSIVNGCDWGFSVHDLETIIVLVLLAFNFIPQRSHHAFTLTRSRFGDSATVTRAPGDGTTAIKVELS